MKKLLVATIAIIGLTGCTVESSDSGSSNNDYTDTNSYTPPKKSQSEIIDETYLGLIYNSYPEVRSMGDRQVVDLGHNLCDEIDSGMTLPQLALLAMEYGVDSEMLGFITGSAIAAYCPWNESFFAGY